MIDTSSQSTSALSPAEAAAHALADRHWRLVIDGRPVDASAGRTFTDPSPVTMRAAAEVPDASDDDVDAAVRAAHAAYPAWRRRPPRERAAILRAVADVVEDHAEELATLDALDAGNPVSAMRADVVAGAATMRTVADWADRLAGEALPLSADALHYTMRQPFGVVARIVAFNHPAMFAAAKVAAPLLAGNTVVLKPSEAAPLSALRIGELMSDVLPPGVLNVVTGGGAATGRALVRHPLVRRIGFVGSEPVGRAIQRDAADTGVKAVTLELGGKNPLVVFGDADPAAVAGGIVAGMNFCAVQGQSCGSTSRVFLPRELHDEVVEEVRVRMEAIRVGSPLDPETEMGALASRRQYDKTLRYIELARSEGARLVTGGGRPPGLGDAAGHYVAPTAFADVTPDMRVAREEVFGPVLCLLRWEREDALMELVNGGESGLTASVWTHDLDRALRFARDVESGYVWVNTSSRHFRGMPFGGMRASGIGREGAVEELLSYTQTKSVNVVMAERG